MKKLYQNFLALANTDFLLEATAELTAAERGQTFPCYHRSAQRAERFMRESGIEDVLQISFPADGKTVYHDIVMPLGWDASVGKLTILHLPATAEDSPDSETENITVADYQSHPFHLVKGSSSLPAGGMQVSVLTESQLRQGASPCGALVMLDALTRPGGPVLKSLLDLGALGFITDLLRDRNLTPAEIPWVNGCTEGKHWHVVRGDRPFVGFAVSPLMGHRIRSGAERQKLLAHVECNGHLYEDKLPVVTGIIPGRRKEEFWLTAHLYEPLSTDNSAGVATVIESMRLVREHGLPEFTIRCVFAMELYGFTAYVASRGSDLSGKVIGSMNCDSLIPVKGDPLVFKNIGGAVPFYGRFLIEKLREELRGDPCSLPTVDACTGGYSDDAFINDPMIGVPTLWPGGNRKLWHNSALTMGAIDLEVFQRCAAFFASCVHLLSSPPADAPETSLRRAVEYLHSLRKGRTSLGDLTANFFEYQFFQARAAMEACLKWTGCESRMPQFLETLDQEYESLKTGLAQASPRSSWRDCARQIIPKRLSAGFVHDGVRLPSWKMPSGSINSAVVARMDGKRNLADAVRLAEYELGHLFSDREIQAMVYELHEQVEARYLGLINRAEFSGADFSMTLQRAGVKKGNLLLVYTGLPACNRVQGGTKSVIKALREAVGENGTVLFSNFTSHPAMSGSRSQSSTSHAFEALFQEFPEAVCSRHSTHSWVGLGPLAGECMAKQDVHDPPTSEDSPVALALRNGGKILNYGCSSDAASFLHYLEARFHMPYLTPACCPERESPFSYQAGFMTAPWHGCRDYLPGNQILDCKFFSRVIAAGLDIHREGLGFDALCLMDMKELLEFGRREISNDAEIFLCDREDCLFCSYWKHVMRRNSFRPHE